MQSSSGRMFLSIARPFRGKIALHILAGASAALASVLAVWFFQRLVDVIPTAQSVAPAIPLLAGYGVLSLCEYLVNYANNWPCYQLYHGIYHHIKTLALRKVAVIDHTAYQDFGTGRLTQTVENGASAGRDVLFEFYLRIASELLPGVVLSIAAMGIYDLYAMLGALAGYLVVFVITKLLLKRLYAIKKESLITEEMLSRTYVRAFMEMVTFRVNRRFGREIERAQRMGKQITDANTSLRLVHEFFFTAFAILMLVIKLLLLALNIGRIIDGSMSLGVLLALLSLLDRAYQPLAIFNVVYVDYKLQRVAFDRFAAFLRAPDDPNMRGGTPINVPRGGVELRDVSFRYGGRDILRGVSLFIEPGCSTAFVGGSGAGKSTAAKLILGLIKPSSGAVLVDGQDLAGVDLNDYYRHIAYVSQDAPVFDGTLRENIAFEEGADDTAVWDALCGAQLGDLARSLPDGLDTPVGERGVKLSGGERQRLAVARVLYQRPAIVILDESTSALDSDTESRVLDALEEALGGKTIISIAHRLDTIKGAGRICVLSDAVIAEQGTHEELMRRGGIYAGLYRQSDAKERVNGTTP